MVVGPALGLGAGRRSHVMLHGWGDRVMLLGAAVISPVLVVAAVVVLGDGALALAIVGRRRR